METLYISLNQEKDHLNTAIKQNKHIDVTKKMWSHPAPC